MRSSNTITRRLSVISSYTAGNVTSIVPPSSPPTSSQSHQYNSLFPNVTNYETMLGGAQNQRRAFSLLASKSPLLLQASGPHTHTTGSDTGSVGAAPRRGGGHLQETPTKDRFPPAAFDPRNPRRRVAILIDGSKVPAEKYTQVIEPLLPTMMGTPVLVRVFDTELRPEWVPLVETSMASMITGAADSSNIRTLAGPAIEWFRVDRFIPVSMQMAADANHLFEYRNGNKVEGVCYVCAGQERQHFEKYFGRLAGQGYAQYAIDESGVVGKLVEDGRSTDGVPPV